MSRMVGSGVGLVARFAQQTHLLLIHGKRAQAVTTDGCGEVSYVVTSMVTNLTRSRVEGTEGVIRGQSVN